MDERLKGMGNTTDWPQSMGSMTGWPTTTWIEKKNVRAGGHLHLAVVKRCSQCGHHYPGLVKRLEVLLATSWGRRDSDR